jgi:hypothetical protein
VAYQYERTSSPKSAKAAWWRIFGLFLGFKFIVTATTHTPPLSLFWCLRHSIPLLHTMYTYGLMVLSQNARVILFIRTFGVASFQYNIFAHKIPNIMDWCEVFLTIRSSVVCRSILEEHRANSCKCGTSSCLVRD